MAGRLVRDGDDVCFVPRFPFVDGTSYAVAVAGATVAVLTRPRPERPAVTEVLAIYPTAAEVPRNLLRFYIWFSAPMSEGYAARHVRLVEAAGDEPLRRGRCWPRQRTVERRPPPPDRPARPGPHQARPGRPPRGRLPPAPRRAVPAGGRRRVPRCGRPPAARRGRAPVCGGPGRAAAGRPRRVGRLRPGRRAPASRWRSRSAGRSTTACSAAACTSPGPDGQPVAGLPEPGPEERSWRLTPRRPWAPGPHQLRRRSRSWRTWPATRSAACSTGTWPVPEDDPRLDRPVAVTFRSS